MGPKRPEGNQDTREDRREEGHQGESDVYIQSAPRSNEAALFEVMCSCRDRNLCTILGDAGVKIAKNSYFNLPHNIASTLLATLHLTT